MPLKLFYRASWAVTATLGSLVVGKKSTVPERESLIVQPSATGDFPKWEMSGNEAPSVVVGVGGKGGPGQEEVRGKDSMVEQVGKMVEDAQQGQGAIEGRGVDGGDDKSERNVKQPEESRNPKKRMWEEDKEAKRYEESAKDEL